MMFKLKQSMGKDKNIIGNGELEMPFNGVPSFNHQLIQSHQSTNHHHVPMNDSSFSPASLYGGFCTSEDISSLSLNPFDSTRMCQTLGVKNPNEHLLDKLGLAENICRMNIGEEHKNGFSTNRGLEVCDTDNVGTLNPFEGIQGFSNGVCDAYNIESFNPLEVFGGNGVCECRRLNSLIHGFDGGTEATLPAFGSGYHEGVSMESSLSHSQSYALYSDPRFHKDQIDYLLRPTEEGQRKSYYNRGFQLQSPVMHKPFLNDGFDFDEKTSFNTLSSYQLMDVNFPWSKENWNCGSSGLEHKSRVTPNTRAQPPFWSRDLGKLEGLRCEDSFIIQQKNLKYGANKKSDQVNGKGCKRNLSNETAKQRLKEKSPQIHGRLAVSQEVCQNGFRLTKSQFGGICNNDLCSPFSLFLLKSKFSSLAELQGYVYSMAKDQLGCRFLQMVFEEGTHQDVHIIFNQLINHVLELMVDPFGNYLVQKLLDVCNEEQRMRFVCMVTKEPGELVRICLDAHGTRVVQKLIETLKTRQQSSLVIQALEPGFLDLVKDLNGNHVIQRCLQALSMEDNKFIFDAAANNCVEIATHRHGCCVLNRCIAHSNGIYQEKMVAKISAHGLLLAQDAFGNYVVQYLVELKIPSSAATLASQFIGHYVFLSMQKFSSHVVEKFLKCFEECRPRIVHELLSAPHFGQLLQDPFANYVIQSALEVTEGPLHAILVEAVQQYKILRTSPYCKKIFTRNLLKK